MPNEPETQNERSYSELRRQEIADMTDADLLSMVEAAAEHPDSYHLLRQLADCFECASELARGSAWALVIEKKKEARDAAQAQS